MHLCADLSRRAAGGRRSAARHHPYIHTAPKRTSVAPDLQRRFIATLAATRIVNPAARSIGKSTEALYRIRHRPGAEGFAAAWGAAVERGVQRLGDCAMMRAIQGTPTPLVCGGKLLGTWDKLDNHLLRFLLQHRLSPRYGKQIGPGHPVYEMVRLQAEQRAHEPSGEEAGAEIMRKVAAIKRYRQHLEREAWLEEAAEDGARLPPDIWCAPAGHWS